MRSSSVRKSAHIPSGILVLCSVAAWFVTGCSRPIDSSPAVTVQDAISPNPPRVGPATVLLNLADANSKPVSGARITLEADMSHAGMAPVFEEAEEIGPGQYQARFKFTMAGDWAILLHVRLAGGPVLERQFNVNGVRPN